MKKENIIITLLLMVTGFVACKPEPPALFKQQDGIYFNAAADSVIYTFAKYPHRAVDTLMIPVSVLGSPSNADREIVVQVQNGSSINAIEGVHFKLLPPYKMPAKKVTTNIPVVIYRTPDLDSLTSTFVLNVKPNSDFELGITTKTAIKIRTGYLQKPATWGELGGSYWAGYSTNFGTWTKTKYKLVLDALYDPASDTTISEFPALRVGAPAVYSQYLQIVKNYIRTNYPGNVSSPIGVGATLRDPDANNNVIQVGPSNY
jgi:hypothetical protein